MKKMTCYEKLAYEYGKTFVPENPDRIGPCYDRRMDDLVCEARSEQGHLFNMRNLAAWRRGVEESLGVKFPDFTTGD